MTTRTDTRRHGGRTVLIIAPFWRHPMNVGNYRVDRYVRWLTDGGYRVVIVRAGSEDTVERTDAGHEITLRDPLTLYPVAETRPTQRRKPSKVRRFLAYVVFNPDPSIVWARRVVNHPLVEEYAGNTVCVMSSGPPESSHIAASRLAERFDTKFIADMRDGWLDEPLKPLLQKYKLQRWREGRIERRVLTQANTIIVTSDIWKEMLAERLPFTQTKTLVLTNAYPSAQEGRIGNDRERRQNEPTTGPIRLIHAGRFTDSHTKRRPGCLLEPLFQAIDPLGHPGVITLLGNLNATDRRELDHWSKVFGGRNWTLEIIPAVPRNEMLQRLENADGLLLLSASMGAIPSKLFEYIATRKPILAATRQDSAVWRVGSAVPQMYLADYTARVGAGAVTEFVEACRSGAKESAVPEMYSEEHVKQLFEREVLPTFGTEARSRH